MYKLVVCDFDGTLFRSDYTVSPRTIGAIKDYISRGGRFAVATGRLYRAIKPFLPLFGLEDGYVIVYQGAGIFDVATEKSVWHKEIETSLAVEAAKIFEPYADCVGMCFHDDVCYAARRNENTDIFADIVKVTPVYVDMTISEFIKRNGVSPSKLLCIGGEKDLLELTKSGRERFPELIFNRSAQMLLEVVSGGTGKGNAVAWLGKKLGIPREQIIAMGDAENDISMIEYAGLGVAMGNAMPSVKKVADVVADTNDRDGVAKIIEEYCKTV